MSLKKILYQTCRWNMAKSVIASLTFAALLFVISGCGKKDDCRELINDLQEQNRKETAKLEAMFTSQIEGYKEKLASIEKELWTKRRELAEAKQSLAKKMACPATPTIPPRGRSEDKIAIRKQPSAERKNLSEEDAPNQFQTDIDAFMAHFKAQIKAVEEDDLESRKEKALGALREKIVTATNESEKELLENRLAKIENAGPEDLHGILLYYEQLDNNTEMNRLIKAYAISPDDLRDYGLVPPPRIKWEPDVKEIAKNLSDFLEVYAPLVPRDQRTQYKQDIGDLITIMSTGPTDEEVTQSKNRMLESLEAQCATAVGGEARQLERRIQRLKAADLNELRQGMQMENVWRIQEIADKYGIQPGTLQQSGLWVQRPRRIQWYCKDLPVGM